MHRLITRRTRRYSDHLARLIKIASVTGLAVGTFWLSVFAATARWNPALSLLILGIFALLCWLVGRFGRFSLGLMMAQIVTTVFIIFFCAFHDVPTDTIPRTCHLFLLVIALVGYINYQRERSTYQYFLIIFAAIAFVIFSATPPELSTPDALPDDLRLISAWFNSIIATSLLIGGVAAMHAEFSGDAMLERGLRSALSNGEFELFYQPQTDVDGVFIGAEALLRWKHPNRGYISPGEFIPVAEKVGLMPRIGSWVFNEACQTLAEWQLDPEARGLTLSINVTADQFLAAEFVQQSAGTLKSYGVEPRLLKLELTESVFVADISKITSTMQALRAIGCPLSLDDFGTGYSSLSYLRQLPLNQLKIDRSFVSNVTRDKRDAVIAMNIVKLGRDLGLEVLAEGIENANQLDAMQSFGCTAFQGFYFAKPMPLQEFRAIMKNSQVRRF